MSQMAVFGIFQTKDQVDKAQARISELNIETTVSGVSPGSSSSPRFWDNVDSESHLFLLACMTIGAIFGALLGILGFHSGDGQVIPTVVLLTGLCGAAVGAYLGLMTGGFMEFELTQDAELYKTGKFGSFLVSAHPPTSELRAIVEAIMDECGAVELRAKREEAVYEA